MKVLHITVNYPTPDYPIFGIFVKEQVESIQKLGIDCEVFFCNGQNKGFKKHITYVPKIWWKVLKGHYDIIHCHHVLSAILLCLTGWPLFKKCIVSYQSRPEYEWGYKVLRVMKVLFNAIIVKFEPGELAHKKIHYLPNGCNQELFRPLDKNRCKEDLNLDQEKRYLLFMDSSKQGRQVKRVDRFNAIYDLLKKEYLYNNIETIILRSTPREMTPIYMNACDLYLMTSDIEGSPNSVKECMCCNTPVVSTPVGNVREMIGDIPGTYVANSFDEKELAQLCDKVLKEKEPFNGRDQFLAKGYGMATVAEKIKNLYKEVLSLK
jgi:glycosyltransferase involved in cell wall biosynthesis